MRDVAHVDDATVARGDRQIVQLRDFDRARVELYEVLERTDLLRTGRQNQILRGNGSSHIRSGKPFGVQSLRIEVHLDLPLLAAIRKRDSRTGYGCQAGANDVGAKVEDLRFGQGRAG